MSVPVALSPSPILQFFDNAGRPLAGGSVLTQVGGVDAPTYSDAAGNTPLPNPIPLNSRGEISTSAGSSAQLFLPINVVYAFTLFDRHGNQIDEALSVEATAITQEILGETLNPRTAAESAAGVTPSAYQYTPDHNGYDVRRTGAMGNGSTDDTAAIEAANTVSAQNGVAIYLPPGTYRIASNMTLSAPVTFDGGAILKPDSGVTVTLNGMVQAGRYQIFNIANSGSLIAGFLENEEVYPEWWGAKGDASTDDSTAIQNCIDAAQAVEINTNVAGIYVSFRPSAPYIIGTGLTFKQGRSLTDAFGYRVLLRGNDAFLFPKTNITAITVVPRCAVANVGTGHDQGDIDIRDLTISGGAASGHVAQGLTIGVTGFQIDAFAVCQITNVLIFSMAATGSNYLCSIISARHIYLEGLTLRPDSGNGLLIATIGASEFCGDLFFDTCDFGGTVPVTVSAAGSNSSVRGVKFMETFVGGTGNTMSCSGASTQLGDFWIDACSFDNPTGSSGDIVLTIAGSSSGQIFNFHITETYFVGNPTGLSAIWLDNSDKTAITQALEITDCNFHFDISAGSKNNAVISAEYMRGLQIHDNVFYGVAGAASTQYINLIGCTDMTVGDNFAHAPTGTTVANGISISDGTSTANNYSTVGNVMAVSGSVVNDSGTGTTKQSANNLALT